MRENKYNSQLIRERFLSLCRATKGSDEPAQMRRLVRAFAARVHKLDVDEDSDQN